MAINMRKRILCIDTVPLALAALVLSLTVHGCALDLGGQAAQDAGTTEQTDTAEQFDGDWIDDPRPDTPQDGVPDRDLVPVDMDAVDCVPLGAEACNGMDDDCDGLIDEDLGETTCGQGDCTNTVPNCLDGVEQECVPRVPDHLICDAPEPACGETTEGLDNCLDPCTKTGPPFCTCTGGAASDITISGANYRVHVFADVGSFTLACEGSVTLDYLVVAGGGGGGDGRAGGGGGAGGCLAGTLEASGSIPVTVGGGGGNEISGVDSSFSTVTAVGGGAGGHGESSGHAGLPGGSGGGGGFKNVPGGTGIPGQGSDGGAARSGNYIAGGGGGGAGGVGTPGTGTYGTGGNGGPGLASDITGTDVTRAGGGAGRGEDANGSAGTGGGGAVGIGGEAGTGGGGGASASGGSGVVIVRYRIP
jgi:hypothetical protein